MKPRVILAVVVSGAAIVIGGLLILALGPGMSAPTGTVDRRASAPLDRGRSNPPLPPLRSAKDLGLRGWQRTEYQRDDWTAITVSSTRAAAAAAARDRPGLTYDESGDHSREPVLTGLIDPADRATIGAALLLRPVKASGLYDAPPTEQLVSLGDLAAAAVQLVGTQSSADALLEGIEPGERESLRQALEDAAAQWPSAARVWQVMAGRDVHLKVRFEGPDDSKEVLDDIRLRRAAGVLDFRPIDGGVIIADASIAYQNENQEDRKLSIHFAYDRDADCWALLRIGSRPADLGRFRDNPRALESHLYTLNLVPLTPGHLFTAPGGLRHDRDG